MNSCGQSVDERMDNPVVYYPQLFHRSASHQLLAVLTHTFSPNQTWSATTHQHGSAQEYRIKKQGWVARFSSFPQSLLSLLLFVYIRKGA